MGRTTADGFFTQSGFLETVELFATLSPPLRERLMPVFDLVRVPAGAWLFRQGDPGDALLVVQSGRLEVMVEGPSGQQRASLLGPGGVLGELALLLGGVRTASVRALRETELLRLGKETFDALLRDEPAFAAAVTRALARQLERRVPATAARTREVAVVAVIGITPDVPAADIANTLCTELGTWGPATRVLPPDGDFDEAEMGRALGALERGNDNVLLVAPSLRGADRWARFCVRQADTVLAVVDPRSKPPPGAYPDIPHCEAVFWTPLAASGYALRPWLDRLRPTAHHLVSPGRTEGEDVARMARRLSGHSLGLVLSGGGARGLAHIGVITALSKAGYTVDRVGGTSMGSLIASLFALGREPHEIRQICHAEMVARNPFNDYAVPLRGLIRGRKAASMLTRMFQHATVESTRRSLFTMAADLLTGQEVIHRQGLIVTAVGTSMCIPGVAPPIVDGDRLLVDGGVLNNLPVDVMAAGGEGPIVAVDVRQSSNSGMAVVVPSMVDTLGRACVLGSWRKTDSTRLLASLVIAPELPGVGLFDFRQFTRIVAEGQLAAESALAACDPDLLL